MILLKSVCLTTSKQGKSQAQISVPTVRSVVWTI